MLYDATHWECSWEHVVDTALNAVSILPVVGVVGHSDEVVMFIKRTDNLFEIRRVAKIGEDIIDTVKRTTNALENLVDSANLAIRRMGQNSYSCLLEALDTVKQGGKMQLCTEYGTDFSKAFAEFGADAENLALTHPSAVQKAYRETIEECTDRSGKVTDTFEEIEETGEKNLKLAEDLAQYANEELNAVVCKYSDDVMSYKFVGEKYEPTPKSKLMSKWEKYDRLSEEMYESYRSSTDDIEKIAENTNWDISDIQQVKAHLFLNELRLDNKVALLDPDIEIALAWSRLIKGEYYDCDILLLKHELYESTYYKLYGCKQREAHKFTCKLFDCKQRETHGFMSKLFNWKEYMDLLKEGE